MLGGINSNSEETSAGQNVRPVRSPPLVRVTGLEVDTVAA